MTFGLNEISEISGVADFSITILRGCIKGLALLHGAGCVGRDLSVSRTMIQCEQRKLYSWAYEVGLFDEPPILRVNSSDAARIPPILTQLEDLLTDTQNLKQEYGLDLEETDETLDAVTNDVASLESQTAWQRYPYSNAAARFLQSHQTLWKRLKWVSVDEQRMRGLVGPDGPIRYFIAELRDCLDRAQRQRHEDQVELMLRALVINTTNEQCLSMAGESQFPEAPGSAVSAAARLRQKGLMLGLLDAPAPPQIPAINGIRLRELPPSHLKGGSPRPAIPVSQAQHRIRSLRLSKRRLRLAESLTLGMPRQLAYYDEKLVLLEWQATEDTTLDNARSRINKVAHFLQELVDPSFHSLQCIGYLEDQDMHRHAYVLEVPPTYVHTHSYTTEVQDSCNACLPLVTTSLLKLIESVPCPSLNVRIRMAVNVFETLRQLHTSGWLHKALCSENLVTFAQYNAPVTKISDVLESKLYLIGYTYARADSCSEMTEPLPLQVAAELYRHPLSLGTSRMRYRASFDLFSLGCTMIEVALWSPFSKTLTEATATLTNVVSVSQDGKSEAESKTSLKSMLEAKDRFYAGLNPHHPKRDELSVFVMQKLEAAVGKTFSEIVSACLTATDSMSSKIASSENEYALTLEH